MGIRGHIQTTQPSYDGSDCFTSWAEDQARDFLEEQGIDIWNNDGHDDTWEIDITDKLKTIVADLCEGRIDFEDKFEGTDMATQGYSKMFGDFLKKGLEVGEKKGYPTIRIDWF